MSSIHVLGLVHHTHISGIIESSILITTVATITFIVMAAVDKLLLRELQKVSAADLEAGFHASHGRESPARTTLTLILDWVNCTICSPVNARRDGHTFDSMHFVILITCTGSVAKKSFVLRRSPVSELVDTNGKGIAILGIFLANSS